VASAAGGAAAAGVVAALGGLAGLVVGLAAGLVVLAALARLLKILPADDAAWLAQAMGARFGGVLVAIGRRPSAEGGRR
jgi:Na+/H+ antiporter NhaD/arsenite permease-like protein